MPVKSYSDIKKTRNDQYCCQELIFLMKKTPLLQQQSREEVDGLDQGIEMFSC